MGAIAEDNRFTTEYIWFVSTRIPARRAIT